MLKTEKTCNLVYWTKGEKVKNLGDYLGEIFLEAAGIKVSDKGSPAYFSIGTLISSYWWERVGGKKIIWGSASCGFDLPQLTSDDEILAVRGPMSREWLGLPEDTALGDPALLLPRVYKPVDMGCGPTLVENFHNEVSIPATKLNMIKKISMKIKDDNWKFVVDRIFSAEFVLANSLHSAIIAHAYGRPWAFYSGGKDIPMPLRWKDWFCLIGIPEEEQKPVGGLLEAASWWDKNSKSMREINLAPLVDRCPWSGLRRLLS